MSDVVGHKLPLGIRLNNPGNLRPYHHHQGGVDQHGDFAKYNTMLEGVYALVKLTAYYWQMHGYRTLSEFLGHYAPPTENATLKYETFVARRLCVNIMNVKTASLGLDRAWRAIDLMRAIVAYEQGTPYTDWRTYPEWIGAHAWVDACSVIPMWKDQL